MRVVILVFTPPTFYAMMNTIKNWEPPYENEEVAEKEKGKIVEYITKECQKEGQTKIIFE